MKASNGISSRTAPADASPGSAASSSSTAERFTLTGPSLTLDERIHAYRRDLADIALAGQIFAPHYARPLIRRSTSDSSVWECPSRTAAAVAPLPAGDEFAVLEIRADWAWGYRRADHHVGYVPVADLEL